MILTLIIIILILFIAVLVLINCIHYQKEILYKTDKSLTTYKHNYNILYRWMQEENIGDRLADYLLKEGYEKIAVYGLGDVGKLLCKNLNNSGISILYGIDQNAEDKNIDEFIGVGKIVLPNDTIEKVDAIIVTVSNSYLPIKNMLMKTNNCPILNLEDVVYKM